MCVVTRNFSISGDSSSQIFRYLDISVRKCQSDCEQDYLIQDFFKDKILKMSYTNT